MDLITAEQRAQLLANGAASAAGKEIDPHPVVKLFTPDAGATWLLTELDPADQDTAFGLWHGAAQNPAQARFPRRRTEWGKRFAPDRDGLRGLSGHNEGV